MEKKRERKKETKKNKETNECIFSTGGGKNILTLFKEVKD
jgi:hypothetical protein